MRLKGWLVYNKKDAIRNRSYIQWILDEAQELELDLVLLYLDDLLYGVKNRELFITHPHGKLSPPNFAIVRTINPLFSKHLELMGVKVFNSALVSELCNDKAKTHQYLAPFNIPMLDTCFVDAEHFDFDLLKNDYPFILKEAGGRGGAQVYMIPTPHHLTKPLAEGPKKSLIVQKIAGKPGQDLRVFVIGQEIIAAILRSSKDDFRANYSLGGKAQLYDLSPTESALVKRIIEHFDFGLVGIDFVFSQEGELLFNEIEDVVGSRTLSEHSDINLIQQYLKYIHARLSA